MNTYFKKSSWNSTPGHLAKERLSQLQELKGQADWFKRNSVETAPAYMEAMKLISKEVVALQDKIAEMITSAEALATLYSTVEEKIGEHQILIENQEEAGEDFTLADAKTLVAEAVKKIEDWKY